MQAGMQEFILMHSWAAPNGYAMSSTHSTSHYNGPSGELYMS